MYIYIRNTLYLDVFNVFIIFEDEPKNIKCDLHAPKQPNRPLWSCCVLVPKVKLDNLNCKLMSTNNRQWFHWYSFFFSKAIFQKSHQCTLSH